MECFIYLTIFAKSETFSFLIPPSKKNLFRSYPLWLCICPVDRFFPLQPQSYHPLPKPSRICFWLLWNPSLSFPFFFSPLPLPDSFPLLPFPSPPVPLLLHLHQRLHTIPTYHMYFLCCPNGHSTATADIFPGTTFSFLRLLRFHTAV